MAIDINQAKEFVKSIDLAGTPRGIVPQDAATEAGEIFDKAKNQAQVVGSGKNPFMVKWVIAAIPAMILLFFIGVGLIMLASIFLAGVGGAIGGLMR